MTLSGLGAPLFVIWEVTVETLNFERICGRGGRPTKTYMGGWEGERLEETPHNTQKGY